MKWSKIEKNDLAYFGVLGHQIPLCWQNTEKVTPRFYSHLIIHGNKGPIWSISVAAMYSECKATENKFPTHRRRDTILRLHQTSVFKSRHGCVLIGICVTGVRSLQQ